MIRAVAAVMTVVVCSALVMGCGDSPDEVSAGDDAGGGEFGEVPEALADHRVVTGVTWSGAAVPLLSVPVDGGTTSVWLADVSTLEFHRAPDLPGPHFVVNGFSGASSRWVVLVVSTCGEPAVDFDIGPGCAVMESSSWLYVLDREEGEWRDLEVLDPEMGSPNVRGLSGDVLRLVYEPNSQHGSPPVARSVDLSATDLELGDVGPDQQALGSACISGGPPITFDSAEVPTRAFVPRDDGGVHEVALPEEARPTPVPWGGVYCHSSGDLLMVTAAPGDGSESTARIFRLTDHAELVVEVSGSYTDLVRLDDGSFLTSSGERTILFSPSGEVQDEFVSQGSDLYVATEAALVRVVHGHDPPRSLEAVEVVR